MRLNLKNIDFAYEDTLILKGINCTFESGRFYSIIGPNGSGKTTLLDLITLILQQQKKEILQLQIPQEKKLVNL